MSLCRTRLMPAARRLSSYWSPQVAVKRLCADVTWPLRNDGSGRSRFHGARAELPSLLGRVCGGNTWGFSPFSMFIRPRKRRDATAFLTGGLRGHRFQPELKTALLHTGPSDSAWLGPVLLSPVFRRCALWEPACGFRTRTALQGRPPGVGHPAAQLSAAKRGQCTSAASSKGPQDLDSGKPNKTQQLKKVFKEYGAVGVIFHISISLMSLGMCYAAISSGIDMTALLFKLGFSETVVQSKMAAGTSTFVLAYAVHKLFAPVRISITLVSVPLLVRYFRKTGLFKPPASSP
ncbi:protein FAM210B [Arapaima gigas]